ncbi:MAG: tetratricopeptide repeat protein [Kiritimatiellae bacterium]|nr:tetratricopeptide repeat protein [Kiritimatiellia bacterium]
MKNNINPYEPCPCGSGKKYKFCCYQKRDAALSNIGVPLAKSPLPTTFTDLSEEFSEKAFQLLRQGVQLVNRGGCKDAISLFERLLVEVPGFSPAANNLALCLFNTGKLDEAIKVLNENLELCPVPNVFGLASLASFYHVKGDEISARRHLKEALNSEIVSADTCTKVCEVLARFKRHKDILLFADGTEYGNDTSVCFYTGTAAANLGEMERAINDLRKVPRNFHKHFKAQSYLKHLRKGTKPHTVCKDWPYLLPNEICPFEIIDNYMKNDFEIWKNSTFSVAYCEAMLNATAANPSGSGSKRGG